VVVADDIDIGEGQSVTINICYCLTYVVDNFVK